MRRLVDMVRELFGAAPALGGGAGDEPGGLFDNRLGVFVTETLRRGRIIGGEAVGSMGSKGIWPS